MPIAPTYPGVYVEELRSGVRTIAGVSTSVTAFIGAARRGPINRPVPIRNLGDFERRFGGLSAGSEMSYAVRQFFNNGGSEAIIVRVAFNVQPASATLNNAANVPVLDVTAADAGSAGNAIELQVVHGPNPNTFTLIAIFDDPVNPVTETFENVSMNSLDARFVDTVVAATSTLIETKRKTFASGFAAGTSVSGQLDLAGIGVLGPTAHQFRLAVNGGEAITIDLGTGGFTGTLAQRLGDIALRITAEATAKGSGPGYPITCAVTDTDHLTITSGLASETSAVHVLPGTARDAARALRFGPANGGVESEGMAPFRPAVTPTGAVVTSNPVFAPTDLDSIPDATHRNFRIELDGNTTPKNIDLGVAPLAGTNLEQKLTALAGRVTSLVSNADTSASFRNFTASPDASNTRLVLRSATKGATSRIKLAAGTADDVLAGLHLAPGETLGTVTRLAGGHDEPFDDSNVQNVILDSVADRRGMFALDSVDLFNLLCLPGITNAAVLDAAEVYCFERRAMLLIDPPPNKTPDATAADVAGTKYPKRKNAAFFYPRIGISDPLRGGAIRMSAPSGALAGVFARTDSTRGVWKAPAGVDASLVGVQSLEYTLTDAENGVLNPRAVNCLRIFPGYGPVSWGARTLVGDNNSGDEWKYIPVRRLALYIEESLYRGTKWAVFEPNDEPLWGQLRMNIGAFMHDLFRQGAFAGSSPRDAYLVKCDRETTTQSDVNAGVVNVLIGFAPLKPAEFVFLKIQQLAGQLAT